MCVCVCVYWFAWTVRVDFALVASGENCNFTVYFNLLTTTSSPFKGGLDSAVLAALMDRVLPPLVPIELINVAFENVRAKPVVGGSGIYE